MAKDAEIIKTGYELSRQWFDWAFDNQDKVKVNHTALYMWFIEKWNRCGQVKKMSVTTSESMHAIGMGSRNTYTKTLKDLVEFGFVEVVSESKNQYQCNIISLAPNLSKRRAGTRTALDQALIRHRSKHEAGTCASTDTINKPRNHETKKQGNQETILDTETNLLGRIIEKVEVTEQPLKIKKEKIKPHSFSESKIFEVEKFKAAFAGSKFETCNLDFYYESVCNWRNKDGTEPEREDWKRVAITFMLKDYKDGKLVMQNHLQNAQTTSRKQFNKSGSSTSLSDQIRSSRDGVVANTG